jgi:hypothetical protein
MQASTMHQATNAPCPNLCDDCCQPTTSRSSLQIPRILLAFIANIIKVDISSRKKVQFWSCYSCQSLILTIELQNRLSLVIKLSKPFKFDHSAVLMGALKKFYLQLSP